MLDLLDTLIRIDSPTEDLEDEAARLASQPAPARLVAMAERY
jgi:hypothetical protein